MATNDKALVQKLIRRLINISLLGTFKILQDYFFRRFRTNGCPGANT
jgi:hypothetical protein